MGEKKFESKNEDKFQHIFFVIQTHLYPASCCFSNQQWQTQTHVTIQYWK